MVEIYSFGEVPYKGWGSRRVWKEVIQGFIHPKPDGCPHDVYQLMARCWKANKWDRPSFDRLKRMFKSRRGSMSRNVTRKSSKKESLSVQMKAMIGANNTQEETEENEASLGPPPAAPLRLGVAEEMEKFEAETSAETNSHVSVNSSVSFGDTGASSNGSSDYVVLLNEPHEACIPLTSDEQASS